MLLVLFLCLDWLVLVTLVAQVFGGLPSRLKISENLSKIRIRGGSSRSEDVPVVDVSTKQPLALTSAYWMPVADCLYSLEVSEEAGLTSMEARIRLIQYGNNELVRPPSKSIFALILEQFEDRLVQILLGVAILSAVLAAFENDSHAMAEPFIIISILILNAVVGIWQSKSAEDSLEALKRLQPDTACVLRDGVWYGELPSQLLVPGDIIYLRVGDKIPADARIISLKTSTFSTDEGSLTGESATVSKYTDPVDATVSITGKTNMVFSGTMVTNGACYAVVTATGKSTEIGYINAGVEAAKSEEEKTPLAKKLDEFGGQLTIIISAVCALVWIASIPKFSSPIFRNKFQGAVYYAKVAVALGVAAIPEGLPAVITLCLSLGTRRMAKKNVIVRKLSSVETLGCTSVICTDKTGTLTTNMMTVKSMATLSMDRPKSKVDSSSEGDEEAEDWPWENDDDNDQDADSLGSFVINERAVEGTSYDPIGNIENFNPSMMQSNTMKLFSKISSLCNEAQLEYKDGKFDRIGEPTEAALKVLVEKLGTEDDNKSGDPHLMVRQASDHWKSQYTTLAILEFNRNRKSMSVLVRPKTVGGSKPSKINNILLVKGASEYVASRCNRVQLEDGRIIPITDEIRSQLSRKFKEIASRPLRGLAMAYKEGKSLGQLNDLADPNAAAESSILKDVSNYAAIENDLILVGFCGIKDPARPEAAEAILKCHSAGIRVIMITGDSKETAIAIARDVNIFQKDQSVANRAFTGREFFALDESYQLELLKTGNMVFCRAEPRDKQRLISMLEKLDEIPAMTGDGVNDAPALQQAAIGIAMGITGTEVAKSAADMILADDNFSTIVAAVEEGRNIYANMQTFVCFLISCNMGEIATIFFSSMLGIPEPLTPLHLLWVNLVTDGPPATALGFNPVDKDVMTKKPRPKSESILTKWMLVRYVITGLYVGFATIGIFIWWYLDKGVSLKQLSHWGSCSEWDDFAHSGEAPHWPGKPCNIFSTMRKHPQSLSLSVLVVMELLKALCAVSLDKSLLQIQPWQNKWLVLSVIVPFLLHLLVLKIPFLSDVFGLADISWNEWKVMFFRMVLRSY